MRVAGHDFDVARPLRIHVPGGFYHATLRGNHRQDIFRHDGERTLLNTIVARAIGTCGAQVHAFCWMSNHIHLLIQVGGEPLSRIMHRIASEYARAFQLSLHTTGHLFENRYFATLVDSDAYLLEVVRYVHQNPVRARMVAIADQYRWSSHRAYAGSGGEPWVTTDFALGMLSADRARALVLYRAFIGESPPAEIAKQLGQLDDGAPLLGRPGFVSRYAPQDAQRTQLAAIIAKACDQYGVTMLQLQSPSRAAPLVAARIWIAGQAIGGNRISLSAVARSLHRDESTLREALQRRGMPEYSGQIEPTCANRDVDD